MSTRRTVARDVQDYVFKSSWRTIVLMLADIELFFTNKSWDPTSIYIVRPSDSHRARPIIYIKLFLSDTDYPNINLIPIPIIFSA